MKKSSSHSVWPLPLAGLALLAITSGAGCGGVANLGTGQGGGTQGGQGGSSGGYSGAGPEGGNTYGGQHPVTDGGSSGSAADTPYPLNPTVPIDADCSCSDANFVCNAARVCVPRCESDGVCAVWRVERGVIGMLSAGEDLYLHLAGKRDILGNPTPGEQGQSSLWKAHYPDQEPRLITLFEEDDARMVGHAGSRTYVLSARRILSVDDDGNVTSRELPGELRNEMLPAGVREDGVYLRTPSAVLRMPLDLSQAHEAVVAATAEGFLPQTLFVGDRIWFGREQRVCSFEQAPAESESCLEPGGVPFAATGGELFSLLENLIGEVYRQNLNGAKLTLYRPSATLGLADRPLLHAGLLYAFEWRGTDRDLIHFPTDHAEEPRLVISRAVARALQRGQEEASAPPTFTVNPSGVFLAQRFGYQQGDEANISRYIFRVAPPRR